MAAVGFLDDHFRVSAWLRLLIHFAAAGWALWQLNGMGPLHLGWIIWDWGWVGQLVALVGLVWMINLYNFMDGIDGIAGLEALCASGLGGLLLAWSGLGGLAEAALVLAGASAGFLVWNWPPAKIFMGDVGSGFLGFVFGVLAISSAKERPWLLWPWLILLSVFIVDSTLTLMRRLITGARWYEAHCSHAYQHAARRWGSHSKVTLTIAAVNVVWLFPLALGSVCLAGGSDLCSPWLPWLRWSTRHFAMTPGRIHLLTESSRAPKPKFRAGRATRDGCGSKSSELRRTPSRRHRGLVNHVLSFDPLQR